MLSKAKSRLITSGKKIFLIFNFSLLIINSSFSQPAIQWQKCFGGTGTDWARCVKQTSDGGFIVAGWTNSNDSNVSGNHGSSDYWVIKIDSIGTLQWQKCLGGTGNDDANFIQQTSDGGYVVAGTTSSTNGNVTNNHGASDYWIVKLNSTGTIQWQKCLGGTDYDYALAIEQTSDGGYIVAGKTQSSNGNVTGFHGFIDYWIVKLDSSGTLQWQKCLGGNFDDLAYAIKQTTDGGFIVAGKSSSTNGDVTGLHGGWDYWIIKTDGIGTIQWQKCFGGTWTDEPHSIQQTHDGGFVVAGSTLSSNGDVTGLHGSYDWWIVKLDSSGILQWQKCLGGTGEDQAYSILQTVNGEFIIGGYTTSSDGDVTGLYGYPRDYWIVELDSNGTLAWQKCLGGSWDEYGYSLDLTYDGGLIVAGATNSNDGDVSGLHDSSGTQYDYWIVKLSLPIGIKEETSIASLNISPNPFTTQTTISFSKQVHNATFSLYNLLGEKVAEVTDINGESFEFSRGILPSGVYVFEVREKEKSIARGKAVIY